MTIQHDFIGRVTAALGHVGTSERRRATVFAARPGSGHGEIGKRARKRTDEDRLILLKELIAQAKPLNLGVDYAAGGQVDGGACSGFTGSRPINRGWSPERFYP
ncbi:MAG: hypothetical protein WBN03_10685 [Desulfobacterales bacterium]